MTNDKKRFWLVTDYPFDEEAMHEDFETLTKVELTPELEQTITEEILNEKVTMNLLNPIPYAISRVFQKLREAVK